jgi:hypothetical protein
MDNELPEEARGVVQIDEHNLDKECIRLPGDYLKWAHAAAEAKRDADERKARLAVIHADLSKLIRDTPGKYGMEKVTEAGLAAAVLLQEPYQKAQARLRQANYESDMTQAVVWALEHKKRSLTLLVDLHGMGYFSSPKVTKAGRAAVEEMSQRRVKRRIED